MTKPNTVRAILIAIWTFVWFGLHALMYTLWFKTVQAIPDLPLFSSGDMMTALFCAVAFVVGCLKIALAVERHEDQP